jgi:hypothetical protein
MATGTTTSATEYTYVMDKEDYHFGASIEHGDEEFLAKKLIECKVFSRDNTTLTHIAVNHKKQTVHIYAKGSPTPDTSIFSWIAPRENNKISLICLNFKSSRKWDGSLPEGAFSVEYLKETMQRESWKEIDTLKGQVKAKDKEIAKLKKQLALVAQLAGK